MHSRDIKLGSYWVSKVCSACAACLLLATGAPPSCLSRALGEEDPGVLFDLKGEDIPKDAGEKIFAPLKQFIEWAEVKVLDVDESVLIRDMKKDESHLRESKARSVLDTEAAKIYFIRTMPFDPKKMEQVRQQEEANELLLMDRSLGVEGRARLRAQLPSKLRGARWETGNDPGAAFIRDREYCVVRRLNMDERSIVNPIAAYRVAGYREFRWAPVLSAADFLLGDGDGKSLSPLEKGPFRILIRKDESQVAIWKLIDGRVEREIVFSAEFDLLPIKMTDTFVSKDGSSRKTFGRSHCSWKRSDDGKWVLDKYEGTYRSPFARAGSEGIYISASIHFTWSVKDRNFDYFDEDTLGLSVPFDSGKKQGDHASGKAGAAVCQ